MTDFQKPEQSGQAAALPGTSMQHSLRTVFPGLCDEQIHGRIDGVIPMSKPEIEAVVASDWFKSLKKSQRAVFACGWFHWLERGSNQHKRVTKTTTPRFAAEAAQSLIAEVSHAA